MASSLLKIGDTPSKTQFRATQLVSETSKTSIQQIRVNINCIFQWRKMVQGFRSNMPVCRHRVRMKSYEDCFTGSEAVAWLTDYLVSSGLFQSVEHKQVMKTSYITYCHGNR